MSYAKTLVIGHKVIESPTWKDVEDAIASIDGVRVTQVTLAPPPPDGVPDGDHHMAIGGGKDGRVNVYTTVDNMEFWNVEDPAKRGLKTRFVMNVGGQESDYAEHICVPKEWALRAAKEYFERGERAPDLTWGEF